MGKYDENVWGILSSQINIEKTIATQRLNKWRPEVVYINCSKCNSESTLKWKTFKQIRNLKKYDCKSCVTKELWNIEEYRKSLLKTISSNEFIENRKKRSSLLWKDDKFRQRIIEKSSTYEFKKKISESSKDRWKNEDYRKNLVRKISVTQSLNRDFISNTTTNLWKNDDYRSSISQSTIKLWKNDDYKNKLLAIFASSNFKEKCSKGRAYFLESGRDSSIERVTQELLTSLGICWKRQYQIGHYSFDLFIPSHNLLVEVQGEYWHSSDRTKRSDASKFTHINRYFPDLRILYLYERDFLNPGIIKQKLMRELFHGDFKEEQIDFKFSDIAINPLDPKIKLNHSFYSAPEEFLQSYHYARFGRTSKKIYGAYLDGELIAVCKFAGIIRKEVATSLDLYHSQVLELDRFCIHPQYQKKNFASWMISRCSKLVFEEFPKVQCLVSFADSTFGHSGTIYKASNWIEIWKTKPSYHYINSEGFVIHKKTLWNHARSMRKTEKEYVEENNYIKVIGKEKTKFILKRK